MTADTTLAPTPGPWTVYNNRVCVWVYAPDGKPVCKADDAVRIEARANATIIAAAPDLLAALRALTDWGREFTSPTDANSPHALLVAACAAIARAEGITP